MAGAIEEVYLGQQLAAPSAALAAAHACTQQRRLDIALRAQVGKQEVLLKDETDHCRRNPTADRDSGTGVPATVIVPESG